jgi:transcriptional regulator with XRE-family HTH domain
MITPALCRAARGWFGWTQPDLAMRAKVGLSTVRDFETDTRTPIANNRLAIQRAFEEEGVKIIMDGERPVGLDFSESLARQEKEPPSALSQ